METKVDLRGDDNNFYLDKNLKWKIKNLFYDATNSIYRGIYNVAIIIAHLVFSQQLSYYFV